MEDITIGSKRRRKIFGVGINSSQFDVVIRRRENGSPILHPIYNSWYRMMARCYRKDWRSERITYQNVTVCKEWLMFHNFYNWAVAGQFHEGYELDKDILSEEDCKIYSPETCCYVPHKINLLLTYESRREITNKSLPVGVSLVQPVTSSTTKIYRARFQKKYLGRFTSPEKAEEVYKQSRHVYVKELLEEYRESPVYREDVESALLYKLGYTTIGGGLSD